MLSDDCMWREWTVEGDSSSLVLKILYLGHLVSWLGCDINKPLLLFTMVNKNPLQAKQWVCDMNDKLPIKLIKAGYCVSVNRHCLTVIAVCFFSWMNHWFETFVNFEYRDSHTHTCLCINAISDTVLCRWYKYFSLFVLLEAAPRQVMASVWSWFMSLEAVRLHTDISARQIHDKSLMSRSAGRWAVTSTADISFKTSPWLSTALVHIPPLKTVCYVLYTFFFFVLFVSSGKSVKILGTSWAACHASPYVKLISFNSAVTVNLHCRSVLYFLLVNIRNQTWLLQRTAADDGLTW